MKPFYLIFCLLLIWGLTACRTASPEQAAPTARPATATPPPLATTATTSLEETAAADLPIDEFYRQVLVDLLQRNPEYATGVGLPSLVGTAVNAQLTDESPEFQAETLALLEAHLATLRTYDPAEQTSAQQLSTAVLDWYLSDLIRREAFAYHRYRLNPLFGLSWEFPNLMLTEQPLTTQADAEAYIARLNQFSDKADEVITNLEIGEAQGVLPPQWMFGVVINDLQNSIAGPPNRLELYTHFAETVATFPDLTPDEEAALLQAAETAVAESVVPGYQRLIAFLRDQSSRADNQNGAWKHPDGQRYYQIELQHHTTTDLTADEIHEIGLAEVARIQAEMHSRLEALGYDTTAGWPELMREVDRDSGSFVATPENVIAEYEALIAEAEAVVSPHFDLLPEAELEMDTIPGGTAYYLPPALDGSRPGVFYAPAGGGTQSRLRLPTTAYHEAIPGHHFQIALQGELGGLPTFRNIFRFTAYSEGWGLYAEQLAAELGLYEDNPYGDIGRLQMELFRAARLVVDTGIHAQGWTRQEAIDYMVENTGLHPQWVQFEVNRYIVWPGQATSYKIGQLKINELRDLAQAELGEAFDMRQFHNVILQNGALPLSVLEEVVLAYIEDTRP